MSIQYLTVDSIGRTYRVTHLYDRFGNDTTDPLLCDHFVLELPNGYATHASTDDAPIYTVH